MAVWILLLLAGVQCAWWLYYFSRVSRYDRQQAVRKTGLPPVSVVICFKDLPKGFESNLRSVLSQDYPDFEVILVDDCSASSSLTKLQSWLTRQNNTAIRVIRTSRDIPGKKQAQQDGVRAAKNEFILFTDMDCRAAGQGWIQYMVSRMNEKNADVVLGYGPMEKKRGFVAWFAGFETVLTALQYIGFHLAGETYMGVGRNWLVKKSVYQHYVPTARGQHLASGDDDLFLQAMIGSVHVTACLHPESFMYSDPKTRVSDFLRQKTRHVSSSVYYPFRISAKLFIFAASVSAYYISALVFLFSGFIPAALIILITMTKWLFQTICHARALRLLEGNRYIMVYPLAELVLAFYYAVLPVYVLLKPGKKW